MTLYELVAKAVGGLIGLAVDLIHSSALSAEEKQKLLLQVKDDAALAHARAQSVEVREV